MVTVQLRDADNPNKVLLGPISLPFELQPGKPLNVRRRFNDTRGVRSYVITSVLVYEIAEHEPERSGIVYLARETEAA